MFAKHHKNHKKLSKVGASSLCSGYIKVYQKKVHIQREQSRSTTDTTFGHRKSRRSQRMHQILKLVKNFEKFSKNGAVYLWRKFDQVNKKVVATSREQSLRVIDTTLTSNKSSRNIFQANRLHVPRQCHPCQTTTGPERDVGRNPIYR